MYINVLTQIGAKAVDQNYIYSVPKELTSKIKVGIRVKIPFGKMTLEGFVMGITNDVNYDKDKIKEIIDIKDIDLNSDKSIKNLIKKIINYTTKYENNEILNITNGRWL